MWAKINYKRVNMNAICSTTLFLVLKIISTNSTGPFQLWKI